MDVSICCCNSISANCERWYAYLTKSQHLLRCAERSNGPLLSGYRRILFWCAPKIWYVGIMKMLVSLIHVDTILSICLLGCERYNARHYNQWKVCRNWYLRRQRVCLIWFDDVVYACALYKKWISFTSEIWYDRFTITKYSSILYCK